MIQEDFRRKLNIDRTQARNARKIKRINDREIKNRKMERIFEAKKAMSGSKILMPVRATRLAVKMRKDNKEEIDESAYMLAFLFACMADFSDLVPVAGPIISGFIKPFLFVFLWGKGAWKVRVVRVILIGTDYIPVINKIPWSVISVAYSYWHEKKRLEEGKKEIVYF